jgi:transposase
LRNRTLDILAIESAVARHSGAQISGNAIKQLELDAVAAWDWNADVLLGVQANVSAMRHLEQLIAQLEQRLRARVQPRVEYRVLKSVPGIGEILATTIMLETGAIERFPKVGDFTSYARCVDSVRLSNNKKKGEGNRKNGNRYLAWAFVEAAHHARRHSEAARRFYERKRAKTNVAVATKALAHKLARACYHMLKEQQV